MHLDPDKFTTSDKIMLLLIVLFVAAVVLLK